MKHGLFILTTALVTALLYVGLGRSAEQQVNDVKDFMRAKLAHSQKVLEGLTLEDFDLIAKHSQEMNLLSKATNWQVLQTPEYLRQSQDFQHATEALTEAAKKHNLDGAALAYVEVTMKCINCHKYVRGVRSAKITTPPSAR